MEKIMFALDVEDDWPPVASEGVWCERSGDDYILLNAPLFIKGIACGDVFAAEPDPVNGQVFEFKLIKESGHSVVWMLNNAKIEFTSLKSQIIALGCSVEEFQHVSLFAIDVPASVARVAINKLLDSAEELGLNLAFPVWRHELEPI